MKYYLLAIACLVILNVGFADVLGNTLHRSDARKFDEYIETGGVYNADVCISERTGELNYVAYFENDNFDYHEDNREYFAVFAAAGATYMDSENATHGLCVGAVCVYEDAVVGMPTDDCEHMMRCINDLSDEEVISYIFDHAEVADRSSTVW